MNEQALKDRLQTISKEKKIRFNECWKQLVLERFLFRLSRSTHTSKFIFKGGFLLAYLMKIGRETTDLDFLLTGMSTSESNIREAIVGIIGTPSEDGFSYQFDNIEQLEQPHMEYPGFHVNLKVNFGQMNDKIQIDIGVGDVVKPTKHEIHLFEYRGKPLFESDISLLIYPPETIFAEKYETIIFKGASNTRMKDYHDLLLLSRGPHIIDSDELRKSIKNTFRNRDTEIGYLSFDEREIRQLEALWVNHIKNAGDKISELNIPKSIQDVIEEINSFIKNVIKIAKN